MMNPEEEKKYEELKQEVGCRRLSCLYEDKKLQSMLRSLAQMGTLFCINKEKECSIRREEDRGTFCDCPLRKYIGLRLDKWDTQEDYSSSK